MAIETYELAIQGQHEGEFNECILHFKGDNLTANETFINGSDLIAAFEAGPINQWVDCLPTSYELRRLAARRATPKPSAVAHKQYEQGDFPGNLSAEAQSDQLCPVIRLIPTIGVVTGGKIFMPCVGKSEINGNAYSANYVTKTTALAVALIGPFNATSIDWSLAIFSRKLLTSSSVTSAHLSPVIGFQSKRRRPVA